MSPSLGMETKKQYIKPYYLNLGVRHLWSKYLSLSLFY